MTTAPFPHHYEVSLEHDHLAAPPRAEIAIGAPPEFGGRDSVWSPEGLLLGAVLSCVKTTFDAHVLRERIPILAWSGRIAGTLERSPRGPEFTSIRVDLVVATTVGHQERLHEVVRVVERSCIVSRALKAPVAISATITHSGTLGAVADGHVS